MSIHYHKDKLHPDSILIRDFEGKVTVDEIIKSWEYLLEKKLISNNLKGVINNLLECELQMNPESFEILMSYLKKHEILKTIKLAVVCDCPENIVFPVLGENLVKELKIKPFSTLEAATHWIIIG